MLELGPETKLTLAPTILLRSVPSHDSYYAFDVASGDQFSLNRTSFWILETIGSGIQWHDLTDAFLETFDVPHEQGLSDLADAVDQSLQDGLIRRNGHGQEGR